MLKGAKRYTVLDTPGFEENSIKLLKIGRAVCVLCALGSGWLLAGALGAQVVQKAVVATPEVGLATFSYGSPSAKATPVLVVNGGPGLSHVYLVQNDVWTRRIAAHRLVVLYDQRGTGESPLRDAGAAQTMEAQVADLDAVRAAMHVDKVDLAGDSYGGLLAAAYAAAHPEHVQALILSDSAAPGFAALHPRLEEVFPDVVARTKEQVAAMMGPDKERRAGELDLRAHFEMIFYSQELLRQYLAHAPAGLGLAPAASAAVSQAIEHLDLTEPMKRFRFPVLVLQGRFDLNVTPDVAWTVAHEIPGAQLVWFEKSGHLPYYEEADKYAATVDQFLAAVDRARGGSR